MSLVMPMLPKELSVKEVCDILRCLCLALGNEETLCLRWWLMCGTCSADHILGAAAPQLVASPNLLPNLGRPYGSLPQRLYRLKGNVKTTAHPPTVSGNFILSVCAACGMMHVGGINDTEDSRPKIVKSARY